MVLPIASNVCHMYRFHRSCLCMYDNRFFIHLVVFASISLFFRYQQAHFVFSSILHCHINAYTFFIDIRYSCTTVTPSFLCNRHMLILYSFTTPPPDFWLLCRTLGDFAQKCLQAKHPCFRVHPETRAWHSFLSDVRKSMITPRRAG